MEKQLAKFMDEFSNGGAIRHLADQNLSVSEIVKRLEYPMDKKKVADMVWKHYLDIGKIRMELPAKDSQIEKVSYVEEYNKFGIPSMRRVVEYVDAPSVEYVPCDFGKYMYQNRTTFLEKLTVLSKKEQSYILDLPWPIKRVYHCKDEFMTGIMRKLRFDISMSKGE